MAVFFSLKLIFAGLAVNPLESAVEANERHIGVAAASYWLIGGMPRINSMVRNIDEVEYMV